MKRRIMLGSMASVVLPLRARAPDPPSLAKVLLTISGRIGRINNPASKTFDFSDADFLRLAPARITTATTWTPRSVFEGPLLVDVMRAAGVYSGTLSCKTLDDYTAPIPWGDLERFGVILAHCQNGQRLSNKRWGPLWTMYPRDQNPTELRGPVAETRFIWQVNRIEVMA